MTSIAKPPVKHPTARTNGLGLTLRDYEGAVHFVPMGEVHVVTNRSHGHSYALLDVGIGYDADVDDAMRHIRAVAERMRAEPAWKQLMLEPIEIAGVERWADSAVVIRARSKVRPGRAPDVRREMLRRLKNCFDREGIAIPYPHMTLVQPARAVRGESHPGGGYGEPADLFEPALAQPASSGR